MIVRVNWLPKNVVAMTIYPFVICNKNYEIGDVVINHERIHLRQQIELLVIPFYIMYGLEYLYHIINFRSADLAYRSISFEREAYSNEKDFAYLSRRPIWNFKNYA